MAPKSIHLIRHAQGFHDLYDDLSMHDPHLTDLGRSQALTLQTIFPTQSKVELVCASPLRRTIETAALAFDPFLHPSSSRKILAIPHCQESSAAPANTGSDPDVLRREFGDIVDLSRVPEGWNSKEGEWAPRRDELGARARELRRWLRSRDEEEVVVVSHGDFLHHVTSMVDDNDEQMGGYWKNVEWRTYVFEEEAEDDPEARLREIESSWKKRAATGPSEEMGSLPN
ncbi:MAG: hypothetical protein M1820_006818 [Bogoriella megaspora]|nr:MAG: hypothetical protein M1820_006818 [Bogoriella megaspora]